MELTLRVQHNQHAIDGARSTIKEILQTEQTNDMACVPDILKRLNNTFHRFPYKEEDAKLLHENFDMDIMSVSKIISYYY